MHNPLRSEADAFRAAMIIAAGAGAVIALTLLTRPLFGAILGLILIAAGIRSLWRGARGTLPRHTEVASDESDVHRVLVVANQTVGGRALLDEIRERTAGRESEILVVTPALTHSQLEHWTSDVDAALEDAERRREEIAARDRGRGAERARRGR